MPEPVKDRPRYLSEHLADLRKALLRSLVAVTICIILAFIKSDWLFGFLLHPFNEALAKFPQMVGTQQGLQTLTPAEAFMINMHLAAVAGLVLASPWILREIWVFAAPALKVTERLAIFMVFCLGFFFFLAGVAFGYFLIIPYSLEFLIRYNLDFSFAPRWTLDGYYGFVMNFLLIFGCVFELPLVLAALVGVGVATPAFLSQKRKHAILGIFILAAFIAPSADPVSQIIVAVPLVLLYEIGIWLSYLAVRRPKA